MTEIRDDLPGFSEGVALAAGQFERLMRGQNVGKTVVRIGPRAA